MRNSPRLPTVALVVSLVLTVATVVAARLLCGATVSPSYDRDRMLMGMQLLTGHATHSREMFGVSATHRRFEIRGALVISFRDGLIGHG